MPPPSRFYPPDEFYSLDVFYPLDVYNPQDAPQVVTRSYTLPSRKIFRVVFLLLLSISDQTNSKQGVGEMACPPPWISYQPFHEDTGDVSKGAYRFGDQKLPVEKRKWDFTNLSPSPLEGCVDPIIMEGTVIMNLGKG